MRQLRAEGAARAAGTVWIRTRAGRATGGKKRRGKPQRRAKGRIKSGSDKRRAEAAASAVLPRPPSVALPNVTQPAQRQTSGINWQI